MTDAPRLFMLLLGCKPGGRFTEQHDIFFGIGSDLKSLVPHIRDYWQEGGEKLHIDAWREVTRVDSFQVDVVPRTATVVSPTATSGPQSQRLFFINLGGYKPDEFDEFHYKMIIAAPDKGEAIRKAKHTAFYRHTGFTGAESHIDDKYGVDVDDIYAIEDILPAAVKDQYTLRLTQTASEDRQDPIRLGYFQLHKL
jgi:hypothetical protein